MLSIAEIIDLAGQAARKWVAVERVMAEPTVDSQGEDALRITLVLDRDVVQRMTGDQVLDVLVDIQDAIQAEGDERLPIVFYATEEELCAEAHS